MTSDGLLVDRKVSLHPAASRWVTLWDGRQALGWISHGTPVFRFRWAPAGLATRRQLRELRLCPGGHEPYALLVWRNGQRWAWLYRLDLAQPSRPASPAKLNALDKAMAARRTCRQCHQDAGYCVPTSDGRCHDCIHTHNTDNTTGPSEATDASEATEATGAGGNEWLGAVA